jgi:ADP-heptose:LPS heptosyltransferase
LTIGELAALMRSARAIICGDQGPALLAAALQTPVVSMPADLAAAGKLGRLPMPPSQLDERVERNA